MLIFHARIADQKYIYSYATIEQFINWHESAFYSPIAIYFPGLDLPLCDSTPIHPLVQWASTFWVWSDPTPKSNSCFSQFYYMDPMLSLVYSVKSLLWNRLFVYGTTIQNTSVIYKWQYLFFWISNDFIENASRGCHQYTQESKEQ